MTIAFIIALGIVIFGVVNYDKMSYKANYLRNKDNNAAVNILHEGLRHA